MRAGIVLREKGRKEHPRCGREHLLLTTAKDPESFLDDRRHDLAGASSRV